MNYNEEMVEISDFDEDVRLRKELIEEAKKIDASNWNVASRQIQDLRRKWKRIHYWESIFEDQIIEEFEGIIDSLFSVRKEGYASNQTCKEDLVKKAEELSTSTAWNKTATEMNDLMTQWKAVGTAGKEVDDALWEKFSAARKKFFEARHDYWESQKEYFEKAKEVKKELIEKAATYADSNEWQKTSAAMKDLMDQWKAVGSAGREVDDVLWEEFQKARQVFFDRRAVHYEELHEAQKKNIEEKRALIQRVKEIEALKDYSRENTQVMKDLGVEWKNIGSCGKDKEDTLWNEFREVMDAYFEGLKVLNEEKRAQWVEKMQDAKARKQDLLQNQKRHLERMKNELPTLLGQRAIDEMQERIEDKEDFISELEEQIADIEKRLEN